jgi:hypothetical protein
MRLESINILVWIFLYITYLIFDVLNIRYILCVQKLIPLSGANYSAILCILTSIGTVSFVDNILNVIPIAFGLWSGTFIALWYEKNKKKQ